MSKQRIARGFPFPLLINETGSKQRISRGALINETSGSLSIVVDALVAIEVLASIASTTRAPLETLAKIAVTQSTIPVEILASINSTQRIPLEFSGSILVVATVRAPIEILANIKSTQRVPLEFYSTSAGGNVGSPIGLLLGLTYATGGIFNITVDVQASIEILSSLQATQKSLIATGTAINATTRAQVEWSGISAPFILDPKFHIVAKAKVTALKSQIGT